MKVLGLCCSPRKNGNTEILVTEALAGAQEAGAETELVSVAGKELMPCDACDACLKTFKCHIKDDMQSILDKLLQADGIIIGSPTWNQSVTNQAASLVTRISRVLPSKLLANKVGAPIAVASRTGTWDVIVRLYLFFLSQHMFCADYVSGLARNRGRVRNDERSMRESKELGKQVVALVNQRLKWPEGYERSFYGQLAERYGYKLNPFD
ncbi:MAG: flavodoxin family protein [Chloroflexi bacterium]|nr:flavodoxin family protein [Chloroflexota bacterium]